MSMKLLILVGALLALTVLSGCTYEECVQYCEENWQGSFDSMDACMENYQCSQYDPGGNGDIPEFTTIGAGLVLLGAGLYAYRKRK